LRDFIKRRVGGKRKIVSKLRIVSYKTMHSLLLQIGFELMRQKGSHVFYRHTDGRTTTVPNHQGRDLSRPLIREILREINLSVDQFEEMLKKL